MPKQKQTKVLVELQVRLYRQADEKKRRYHAELVSHVLVHLGFKEENKRFARQVLNGKSESELFELLGF